MNHRAVFKHRVFRKDPTSPRFDLPCNGDDGIVNGRNDLVNLCPLAVDLPRQLSAWGDRVRYELVTGAPGKMRFVPARTRWDDVASMVGEDQSVVGSSKPLHEAAFVSTDDGKGRESVYEFPDEMLRLGASGSGVLAVEFAEPGYYRPTVRIREKRTGDVLLEYPLDLRILDVHDMYRWVNLVDSWDWFDWRESHATDLAVSWPDSEHADANVVFVHGYNVAEREAWDWSQAMFKRLWWTGADAGFTAVRWRGDESQVWVPKMTSNTNSTLPSSNGFATKNFYQNVFNAFQTAERFSAAVNALPGSRKYMVAHSLGNMLVSAARQFHGLEYEKYIMLNAAVPMEACDTSPEVFEESKDNMTPRAWVGYPDWSKASRWYDLFPEGDSRRGLTWRGLFKDVDNTVNFYSTKDEVLMNGDGKDKKIGRKYVWYLQETKKGEPLVDFISEAGWEFGNNYLHAKETHPGSGNPRTEGGRSYTYVPWSADEVREKLKPEDVMKTPLFQGFNKWCITRDDGWLFDGGDKYLREHAEERFHILARGIPAESFAIGANPVPKWGVKMTAEEALDPTMQNSEIRNIDMAKVYDPKAKKTIDREWIHSYFIKMSLFDTGHVFRMISDIIGTTKGKANGNETR